MMIFVKRRALSTVVTTALLLTAVAVMGTGVVAWSNYNLRTFETNLVTSASNNTNKINETPIIENIVLVPNYPLFGINSVNVTVTNVGTIGFNVAKIQISDSTQSITKTVSGGNITPHSSKLFSYSYQWIHGSITTVQVITARGTIISSQAMQP